VPLICNRCYFRYVPCRVSRLSRVSQRYYRNPTLLQLSPDFFSLNHPGSICEHIKPIVKIAPLPVIIRPSGHSTHILASHHFTHISHRITLHTYSHRITLHTYSHRAQMQTAFKYIHSTHTTSPMLMNARIYVF
jgi:hypothetical protein